jgi:hypothetical protein
MHAFTLAFVPAFAHVFTHDARTHSGTYSCTRAHARTDTLAGKGACAEGSRGALQHRWYSNDL